MSKKILILTLVLLFSSPLFAIQYKVIVGDAENHSWKDHRTGVEKFEDVVQSYLDAGWELQGGVVYGDSHGTLAQAMIKR